MISRLQFLVPLAALLALAGCANPSRERLRPTTATPPTALRSSAAGHATTAPAGTRARDAFVLLSGGGTPLSNNYSQYVQAKAIAGYFAQACPPDSTWVFFGPGNRDGEPAALADVRREFKRDGLVVQSWLPGSLPNNRPATRQSFLRALRDEVLPAVQGGGTVYLFVGDHGELAGRRDNRESAITLWQLKRGRRGSGNWYTDAKEILGVAELHQILSDGLGTGRVVFCMTQCHSGGFHQLGIAREMLPPRAWFTSPPAWAGAGASGLRLPVAGFTATDQQSPAAGCDADPDPERWAGYERFMPESLLGVDLLSGEQKGRAVRTLAEAHEAATLVDHTIDKPHSTAEHYLGAWAEAIETRLARTLQLTSAAWNAVAAYQRAVDTGRLAADSEPLRARQAQFQRFTSRLAEHLAEDGSLLLRGTRQELEAAIGARERTGRGPRRSSLAALRRAWTDTLRPAWKAAVLDGRIGGLDGAVLEFEKHLLQQEDDGSELMLPRGADHTDLLNEIYWNSGFAEPATLEPGKAAAVARWGAERRGRIVAWGKSSGDAALRVAAEKIGPGPRLEQAPPRPLSRKTAAERVLFYRRVLAAWEFLLAMEAQPALAELQTLIELERTPLPPARPVVRSGISRE